MHVELATILHYLPNPQTSTYWWCVHGLNVGCRNKVLVFRQIHTHTHTHTHTCLVACLCGWTHLFFTALSGAVCVGCLTLENLVFNPHAPGTQYLCTTHTIRDLIRYIGDIQFFFYRPVRRSIHSKICM